MIARPRSAATNTELPASLVLTSRELKHYRRFQAQTTNLPPKSFGRLPTAAQYADFQAWLAKRDSGYLSDTPLADIIEYVKAPKTQEEKGKASLCGHTLHPVHKEKAERCPVCTVEIHTNYMRLLDTALEDAGGQVKQRWETPDQDSPALQAWYAGKLAFVKEISRLESFIQDEEEYNQLLQQKNSPVTQSIDEAKTASQALVLHWNNLESTATSTPPLRRKKSRSVIFCPDTNFDTGRDQLYFWRRSPRYEAGGKYSSDDGDELDHDHADSEELETLEQALSKSIVAGKVPTLEHDLDDEEDEESEEESSDEESDDEVDEDEEEDDEEDIEGADFIVFG